jgi:hypothetical protein
MALVIAIAAVIVLGLVVAALGADSRPKGRDNSRQI